MFLAVLVRYEYPLNEGIRTMLRLEHLFDRLGQLIARDTTLDHHFALATLFEITDVIAGFEWDLERLKPLHLALSKTMNHEVEARLGLDGAPLTRTRPAREMPAAEGGT